MTLNSRTGQFLMLKFPNFAKSTRKRVVLETQFSGLTAAAARRNLCSHARLERYATMGNAENHAYKTRRKGAKTATGCIILTAAEKKARFTLTAGTIW